MSMMLIYVATGTDRMNFNININRTTKASTKLYGNVLEKRGER